MFLVFLMVIMIIIIVIQCTHLIYLHCYSENVAYHGNTSQSSTLSHFVAQKAVDGDRTIVFKHGSCMHTDLNQKSVWWQVVLNPPTKIHKVAIYYSKGK